MHFPAAVILASSLTDFVLGSPFPASDAPALGSVAPAVTAPAFASSTQKTAAMNNLQTTTGKIYASMPSNPHAFALTNNMKAIKAKIFYTGHPLLNT
ncbi:hypothetical protein C8J57DRAFT_1534104 [Mycena rebaudengoi]|nr:hypothetical protein C8J57DRAFT_1534104 [Mycena rebaudengoi]